jgi:hypothetical protein
MKKIKQKKHTSASEQQNKWLIGSILEETPIEIANTGAVDRVVKYIDYSEKNFTDHFKHYCKGNFNEANNLNKKIVDGMVKRLKGEE